MRLNFTFKHLDRSEALEKYCSDRLNECARFLLKDSLGTVLISKHNYEFCAEISVNTRERHFRAQSFHVDPYQAVDAMVDKLEKQLKKMRRQVQSHKSKERSKSGRLEQMNDRFEIMARYRKAA